MKIVINGILVDESTQIEYVAVNPKRVGYNAYDRFDLYMVAKTIGEYKEICSDLNDGKHGNADLKYDHSAKYLKLFDIKGNEL